jgi:hypothetical protein
MPQKITEQSVKQFITEVKNACPSLVERADRDVLNSIPPGIFEQVLRDVYGGDTKLARNVMSNRFDLIDFEEPELEVRAIKTVDAASDVLLSTLEEKSPVLLITDTDNDGSLAQAIAMEMSKVDWVESIDIQSKEYNPTHHGFDIDQIERWLNHQDMSPNDNFSVLVADLGTNQKEEQIAFLSRFPNANLIVADHHKPEASDVMKFEAGLLDVLDANRRVDQPGVGILSTRDVNRLSEVVGADELENMWTVQAKASKEDFLALLGEKVNLSPRSFLVSPFAKGSMGLGLRDGGGVSGGFLLYTLFREAADKHNQKMPSKERLSKKELNASFKAMQKMGRVANLLDYVKSDIRLKPLLADEIKSALELAKLTRNGRSLGKWVREGQSTKVEALESVVGAPAVSDLLTLQEKMIKENHVAAALVSVIPDLSVEYDDDGKEVKKFDDDGKQIKFDLYEAVSNFITTTPAEETISQNYVEALRPFVFNFHFESTLSKARKGAWIDVATRTLKNIGVAEREMLEIIREHQLISEISEDYAMITQPISKEVGSVFTDRQLTKAYHSMGKPITMSVTSSRPGQLSLSMKSEGDVAITDVIFRLSEEFDFVDASYRGHSKVGGLSLKYNPTAMTEHELLKAFVSYINKESKQILNSKPLPQAFELTTFHLKTVKEVLEVMRVHLDESAAPAMMLRLSPDMNFEDKDTLRILSVADLVTHREWDVTNEYLDFGMTSSLMLPNQALKAVSNDGYEGGVGLTLMANGTFIANKVFTGEQIAPHNIPKLSTPLDAERKEMVEFYKKHFFEKGEPVYNFSRKEGIEAIKFTMNPERVYDVGEALALSLLREKSADTYAVLDVEALGGGNSPCHQLGIFLMKPIEDSGTVLDISSEEFEKRLKKNPNYVRNWYKRDDGEIVVNERMKTSLHSFVISQDGSVEIKLPFKASNLTNMDQSMLREIGMTSKQAQDIMVELFKAAGKFVIQAHNLPYDNNIMRVNFPEVHKMMSEAIHLDSAPIAKNNQIAYMNLRVNPLGGYEFFNAEHEGYNLDTLFKKGEDFTFPSIKGDGLLKVEGDDVYVMSMTSRVTTKLKESKAEVMATLAENMGKIAMPRYGIAKLLHVATIHDMIENKPVKDIEYIPFEEHGMPQLDKKLWKHFQDHYAFDLTPSQNVMRFSVLPNVRDLLDEKIVFADESVMPPELLESVVRDSGESFKVRSTTTKKAKESMAQAKKTLTYVNLLKYNAENFVKANPENAERYALAWAYEMVLAHHEVTTKNVPASFIAGVEEAIGVSKDVVKMVYDDTYRYKDFRNIPTYTTRETHSNFGPEGDNYQEYMSTTILTANKTRNPYLTPAICLRLGLNPLLNVLDTYSNQAAESTLKQFAREVAGVSMDSQDMVNASAKQMLNQFSSDGISLAVSEEGIPRFKCKSLSHDKVDLQVLFPEYKSEKFIAMPDDEREKWKGRVELAVTSLLLSNSLSKMKEGPVKTRMLEIATSPSTIDAMEAIKKEFGLTVPTEREKAIKSCMGSISDAILGKVATIKLPINRFLNPDDITSMREVAQKAILHLSEQQNFDSYMSMDNINESLDNANFEYKFFDELVKNGEAPAEIDGEKPAGPVKSMLTKFSKLRGNVLTQHIEANEGMAGGLLNQKTNPIKFILESDLKYELMDIEPEKPSLELKNDNPYVGVSIEGVTNGATLTSEKDLEEERPSMPSLK